MKNLTIEATKYTPQITMDFEKGLVQMEGKSYPENTFEFYEPIMKWMEEYFEAPQAKTTIELEIIYFNSSSSKLFFDFFDLIEEYKDKSEIEIKWIYDEENESAMEAGEDFQEDFESLNFNLIKK